MFLRKRVNPLRARDWNDPFGSFSDMFGHSVLNQGFTVTTNTADQSYQTKEENDRLTLMIDVPGVKAADITVTTSDASITVTSTRDGRTNRETYHVDNGYDASSASALLQDGVLTLTLVKLVNESKSKQIEVKTA